MKKFIVLMHFISGSGALGVMLYLFTRVVRAHKKTQTTVVRMHILSSLFAFIVSAIQSERIKSKS